jgi:hypothetical protein
MEERARFPENRDGEFAALFNLSVSRMPMPYAEEKCINGAKARMVPKAAELTDLYGNGESEERSSDHAASVALP